jgi:hypothetical protein
VVRGRAYRTEDWQDETEQSAFVRLWLAGAPPRPMGTYFEGEWRRDMEQGNEPIFLLRRSREERGLDIELRYRERLDDWTVRFEYASSTRWREGSGCYVRKDARATHGVLGRQERALELVAERFHHLSAQLYAPGGIEIPEEHRYTPQGVAPDTVVLIQRILETWPLFALHGPPGTGKSFVARHVISGVLEADPYARILVAAQSHHALDNLLESVEHAIGRPPSSPGGEAGAAPIILRLASPRTRHKVSSKAEHHLFDKVLDSVVSGISKAQARNTDPHHKSLTKRWRKAVKDRLLDLDISQRLRRSASIVFTTCAGATPEALGAVGGPAAFDWVIIEEAARGWITEMLVPLVNGSRWLLIGDHRQLPAFNLQTIQRLLARDISDGITSPVTDIEVTRAFEPFLTYFRHLSETDVLPGRIEPRDRLRIQRRMHPTIGKLVSQAYYANDLDSHASTSRAHGLMKHSVLVDKALVWLDTSAYGSDAYESGFLNYCECKLLEHVVLHHNPTFPKHDKDIPSAVVLSPYLDQVKLLQERLTSIDRQLIHSVDSFQGREAEVVMLSLVRNNGFEGQDKAIGFLAEPERANVMLSRARRLLVIAGNLEHFARFPETHWGAVIDYARQSGAVVAAEKTGFRWRK